MELGTGERNHVIYKIKVKWKIVGQVLESLGGHVIGRYLQGPKEEDRIAQQKKTRRHKETSVLHETKEAGEAQGGPLHSYQPVEFKKINVRGL